MMSSEPVPHLKVDNWCLGRRGNMVQRPLAEALTADGRVEQRLVFSEASGSKVLFESMALPRLAVPGSMSRRILAARASMKHWYNGEPRLVHNVMPSPWDYAFADIPKKFGATILITVHNAEDHLGEGNFILNSLYWKQIAGADHIAVLSKHAGELLRKRSDLMRPIHVVAPGLIMDSRQPSAPRLAPMGRPLKILFFGRLVAYKGLQTLLDAWEMLRRDGLPPVELTVACSGDISTNRAALSRNPDVRLMHGWMSDADMELVFAEHDVNILPYREGSLSATALAGMWAGIPTIATPISGLIEQLRDAALYTHDLSAGAVAASIRQLADSPDLYTQIARNAHAVAVSLSASMVAANWHDLYREISPARPR